MPRIKKTVVESQHTGAPPEVHSAMDELWATKPAVARIITSFALCFVAGLGIAYVAASFINLLMTVAMYLTASATFTAVIWVMGVMVTMLAAKHAALAIHGWVMSGDADKVYASAKEFVQGKRNDLQAWWITRKAERELNAARTVH